LSKQNRHKVSDLRNLYLNLLRPEEKWIIDRLFNNIASPIDNSINLQHIEQFAISNGLGPLTYYTSQKLLPEPLNLSFKKAYLRNLAKNTQIEHVIGLIQSAFEEAKIPVLFLKGSILAFTRYADSTLRPMSDVDIIVPIEKAQVAYQLLQQKGAIGCWRPMNETDHHLPPLTLKSTLIEIHTHLFPVHAKFSALNNYVWKETMEWKKELHSLPGPSIIHHAFYIATHIYYNFKRGGIRLCWFYDLMMLHRDLAQLSGENIKKKAIHLGLEEPLTFTGTLYSCISKTPLPNWPLFEEFLPSPKVLNQAIEGFREGQQQDTRESYQIILEQIANAPTLKQKRSIIIKRLTKDKRLKGWPLIRHLFTTLYRLFNYMIHQAKK